MTEQVNWTESQSPLPGKPTWDDSTLQRKPNSTYPCTLLLLFTWLSHGWLFVTLWTVASQTPLYMEFPRQEYWSGLPFICNSKNGPKQIYHLVIHLLKNWCFWTVVLQRLLRVPWTARRPNQSILKEISPGCSLEGLMLKLKLQYFGHLMRKADSFEKTLMLGKIEGRLRRGWQNEMVGWHHRLNGHGFGWTPGIDNGQGGLVCCSSWGCKELDTTEGLNWCIHVWQN